MDTALSRENPGKGLCEAHAMILIITYLHVFQGCFECGYMLHTSSYANGFLNILLGRFSVPFIKF